MNENEYYPSNLTFTDYIPIFIGEKTPLLSPVTVLNYSRELRRAEKYLGQESMGSITFAVMKKYLYSIRERERNRRTGKELAYGTMRQHYIVLHSFFENALENGAIGENPMCRLKHLTEWKGGPLAAPLSYDEEQVRYIIKCLENEPLMWRAAVLFAIDSGCRCGEIMGLKWSDINLDSGRVIICRNVQYIPALGTFVCSPKNGKSRTIFLNRPVLECLGAWRREQGTTVQKEPSREQKNEGYCFTGRDGSPLIPVAFNNYLFRFGKKYGLPGIHPHALRHTMASLSIANGADIVSVSNKLGHANVSITLDIYSHSNFRAQLRANEILADAVWR